VIQNIRSRVERCRRLAGLITDKRAIEVLLQIAREGEQDIDRLQAASASDERTVQTD
jgi:hypothetical protein